MSAGAFRKSLRPSCDRADDRCCRASARSRRGRGSDPESPWLPGHPRGRGPIRRAIRRDQRRHRLVASHKDLKQILGRRGPELLDPEVFEHGQINARELLHETRGASPSRRHGRRRPRDRTCLRMSARWPARMAPTASVVATCDFPTPGGPDAELPRQLGLVRAEPIGAAHKLHSPGTAQACILMGVRRSSGDCRLSVSTTSAYTVTTCEQPPDQIATSGVMPKSLSLSGPWREWI